MPFTLAILIAIAIIVVYFVFGGKGRQESIREKYRDILAESNGTFDESAKEALKIIGELDKRESRDAFTAARILELNEGDAEFTRNRGAIAALYAETLRGIDARTRLPAGFNRPPGLNTAQPPLAGLFPNGDDADDTLFMVDYIGGFIDRNAVAVQPALVGYYAEIAPRVHQASAKERVESATRTAATKAERVERAADALQTHVPDAQNSHDSSVNAGLRATLDNLRNTTRNIRSFAECSREIQEYLQQKYADDKGARARQALGVLSQDAYNSTIGASERDVFRVVWSRADENTNTDDIRDAIVDAMDDFYDRRADGTRAPHTVCINGRDSRLLSSLATLDRDPTVGAVQTLEQHKNDVMQEVKDILHREIDNAAGGDDEGLRSVARSYKDPNVATQPQDEERFKDIVRREIDIVINAKRDVLGQAADTVKSDAYAAL